ncbi:glycosyltransferase family 39 protein [Terriglobus roseus]|nr:glycosyltransferase family 39 protein [Terriglobus roseus]
MHPLPKWFRPLIVAVLALGFLLLIAFTYKWPLIWDAQIFHYANFLVDHGYRPYKDITDMNLPGAYLVEGGAMHLFGGGDLAWRMYDFSMLLAVIIAGMVIAAPYDWLAGLFSGVLFAVIHSDDGPIDSAQRDEAMAMMLMVSYAFLFEALRRRKAWLLVPPGFLVGIACSIKPTFAPLGLALFVLIWFTLRKRGVPAMPYLACGLAGALGATALVLGYLLHYGSLGAFITISRTITPYYSQLTHFPLKQMAIGFLPFILKLLLPFSLIAAFYNKSWREMERPALLLAVLSGAFSYFIQHKGNPYHRYPLTMFLPLWLGIELALAMRKPQPWLRAVGAAGIALGTLVGVPYYLARVHRIPVNNRFTPALVADLKQLGGDRLQHKVQCVDMVDGCYNALYRLKLLPSSGSMGDLLYFSEIPSPVVDQYRDQFQRELALNPPSVIVLSNVWFTHHTASFDKLQQWPAFATYLDTQYDLAVTRNFPAEFGAAYRLYLRKGSNLPPPQAAN